MSKVDKCGLMEGVFKLQGTSTNYHCTMFRKKGTRHAHGDISVKSEPIFKILSMSHSFAVKLLIKIQQLFAHVATIPCEELLSENK